MTTTPAPVQPAIPPHSQPWNTLQILKGSRAVILALTALLLVLTLLGVGVHRAAMKTIGNDTAPSIIAAQNIKAALAGMDAAAADELLTPPGLASGASAVFERRRMEASDQMIVAAKNVTFGEAELAPLKVLQETTGTYERLVQQALDFNDEGQPDMAIRYYRAASMLMDYALLPAADELDRVNDEMMGKTYESETRRSLWIRVLCGLCGLVALGALLRAQLFLSQRTHRTLNPLLLLATVLTFWLTAQAFTSMGSEEKQLKIAREDAFSSIGALWRARAVAYSANAEESRYLLDPRHALNYQDQAEFVEKASKLAPLAKSETDAQAVLRAAQSESGVPGFLGDELRNITFDGELQAATLTLADFEQYVLIDRDMRHDVEIGALPKAIDLRIGTSPGDSNFTFEQFDSALGATLKINQDAFKAAVERGFDAVKSLEIEAAITAAITAVLVFLGFAGRIREYQ